MEDKKAWLEKGKRVTIIAGVTIGVYLVFRFILPLVIPFLFAYALSALIAPVVGWMERKLHIKRIIGTIFMLLVLSVLIIFLGSWLISKILIQFRYFISQLPMYQEFLLEKVSVLCSGMEKHYNLEENTLLNIANHIIAQSNEIVGEKAMPMVVSSSVPMFRWILGAITVSLVTFVSIVFISRDYPQWKKEKRSVIFGKELRMLAKKLSEAGGAYLKTQCILMFITSLICIWGFIFMKSPYALILGMGIGIVDALPLLGTGLVFIPWIIISFILGEWKRALMLLLVYLSCYMVRQFLEPKLMGKQIGVTSLEMIMSMYIGLQLFSLAGVILGPVGYLVIKEIVGQMPS